MQTHGLLMGTCPSSLVSIFSSDLFFPPSAPDVSVYVSLPSFLCFPHSVEPGWGYVKSLTVETHTMPFSQLLSWHVAGLLCPLLRETVSVCGHNPLGS